MSTHRLARSAGLALLVLVAGAQTGVASEPALLFEPCEITGSGDRGLARLECASFTVAENPAEPDGAQIDLFVARLKALAPTEDGDAVTLINGGPGGSSIDMLVDLMGAFSGLRQTRDLIVVDQRGTGRSNAMTCSDLDMAGNEQPDLSEIPALAEHCLAELPGDARFYTTSIAVQDLDALRQALGYTAWNVYGVSYGSRVALHYLRRFPEHTRSLIIDGIMPPDEVLGIEIADNAQDALDGIFERCAASAACAAAFSELPEQFDALQAQLSDATVEVTLADPSSGEHRTEPIGFGHIAIATRLMSYSAESMSVLPLLLSRAADGDLRGIAGQALAITEQLTTSIAYGMHNSVVCSEDADRFPATTPETDAYLGKEQLDTLRAICSVWPRGPVDEDFSEPFDSDVPVLVLSGEHDPVTPARYGDRVDAMLSNSRHIVAAGQGHGVIGRGCVPTLAQRFIDDPDPAGLDISCTERLSDAPFFVSPMGPAP